MKILDIIVILIILISAVIGFKRGVFKETVIFIGTIVVIFISYKLKNIIGDFLVLNFPFMDFPYFLKGAVALNIIVYQSLAFILTASILFLIYDLILYATGIFEKLLRITIILGIPSKILGFIVGAVEGYIIAYIFVFIVKQPILNFPFTRDSKYGDMIVEKTPILSNITKDTVEITKKISNLSEIKNVNEMNLSIIDLILENKVTSVDIIERLIDKNKLNVKNIDIIINKYKKESK